MKGFQIVTSDKENQVLWKKLFEVEWTPAFISEEVPF